MTDPSPSRTVAVIVDAIRGERSLDVTQSKPLSLSAVRSRRTVLDWTLHALDSAGISRRVYVGAYHIQKVMERYPQLEFRYHAEWEQTGELGALPLVPFEDGHRYVVIRAGTLVTADALGALLGDDRAVTYGTYDSAADTFAGLMAVPAPLAKAVAGIAARDSRDAGRDLGALVPALRAAGVPVVAVDVDGRAAPVWDRQAVARAVFRGKGHTLQQVGPLLTTATVLDQRRYSLQAWAQDPEGTLDDIQRAFDTSYVIIRSSATAEDGLQETGAGRFLSVLDVPRDNRAALRDALASVVRSYGRDQRATHALDEVLVQPQVRDLAASGVILTRDLETGAPYYVINVDRTTGRSDVVTSGARHAVHAIYAAHIADEESLQPDVQACVRLAREIEDLTQLDALDIEFGIDRAGTTYLFQVRPLASREKQYELGDADLYAEIAGVRAYLERGTGRHPLLAGGKTLFGNMPDWNPAEMIGTTPRPLALSLYQRLIGARAWAEARAAMGYRDVRPVPLIVSLGGRPYVDVRASLNSFLPAGLDERLAERWIDHCLRILETRPELHDKIEFDVAVTCMTFDFDVHAARLRDAGLEAADVEDMRRRLLALTDRLLRREVADAGGQLAALTVLEERRHRWLREGTGDFSSLAARAAALLTDCERFGTIPFAILARNAFVAMSMLRSLVARGVFTDDEFATVCSSIPTVASELSRDLTLHRRGELSLAEVLERYGHLRPSSYDITSPNYAAAASFYIAGDGVTRGMPQDLADHVAAGAQAVFDTHRERIAALLQETGFTATVDDLARFITASLPGRERAKFEFMRTVDTVLATIQGIGAALGFTADEMSYLPVSMLERGASDSPSAALRTEFRREIGFQRKRWNLTCALRLPHLVRTPDDVMAFEVTEWSPNFISTKRVTAPPVLLESGAPAASLDGRIVLIHAADPGYDWVFGHAIAGLITEYGGAASHMAIRAAEFAIPAAIGCGAALFEPLKHARLVELDCAARRICPHP